ncbi:hypothetical protein J3456_18775 [Sulfitobacter sp. NFXS29]|uniref:hypothetical protein n=1 Tax=Sulfitobacter sp. NFXS29 TaxID=2818438 RepID=UPI0032DF139C
MGWFDEDHDAFYTEDSHRTDIPMLEREWNTCTDLFADRGVMVDILMASDQYETREAADAAMVAYVDETYGAHIIELGGEKLHIYAPTGYGVHHADFASKISAQEIDYPEWREDYYVLSKEPLTFQEDLLEPEDWTEGRITPKSPDAETDAPEP